MLCWWFAAAGIAAPVHIPELPDTPIAYYGLQLRLADGARLVGAELVGADTVGPRLAAAGAWLTPLHAPETDRLLARARARSGRAVPDLRATFSVRLPTDGLPELHALAEELADDPAVDWIQLVAHGSPPPADIAPPTPSWESAADFQDPAVGGLDVPFLRALGITGARVMLHDVEYGWIKGHEDLRDASLFSEPGVSVPWWVFLYGWDAHGAAAVGEVAAPDNGFGMRGVLPDIAVGMYPEFSGSSRRAAAIASAAANAVPGDVIMLEMQTVTGSSYGPAELERSVFDATQVAVAAGIVVVGAAGNGAQNLDSAFYQSTYGAWGDSGAILVGAGNANNSHRPIWFTTFGSRVDVQGWGEGIHTLGYGDLAYLGSDWDQTYTADFGGTSGATPIAASAAAAVQDFAIAYAGTPLPPRAVRRLLRDTGIPQGFGVHIGPFPDVVAALTALDGDGDAALTDAYGGLDCNDADATVHPGATDVAGDALDADCDGSDLPRLTLAVAPGTAGVPNAVQVTNAEPGAAVQLLRGPAGLSLSACGALLGVSPATVAATVVADAAGVATLVVTPPAAAAGMAQTLQAHVEATCRVSEPVAVALD